MRNRDRYNETKKRNNIILVLAILLVLLFIGFGTFWMRKNFKTDDTPTTTESLIGEDDTESSTKVAASTEKGTTEVKGTNKGKKTTEGKTTRATTEEGVTEGKTTTETPTTEGTSPTERPTTTEAPTTERSTTERPTTERPTTTEAPTTERPTTERPTTEKPTTQEPSTECKHDWVAQYETKTEKVEVESAWDEEITEKHPFCTYCGKDVLGDPNHIGYCGEYYYSDFFKDWIYAGASSVSKSVVVDVIHHPAKYETKKTKVLIGYKCSKCGATK